MPYLLVLFISSTFLYSTPLFATVLRVIDGDTVVTEHYTVRLAHIDAPELSQDHGKESKYVLEALCLGREEKVTIDAIDRYGRIVGVLHCEGLEANLVQVEQGMAWGYRAYSNNPFYLHAEASAKRAKVGLWRDTLPLAPWEHRRLSKQRKAVKQPSCKPGIRCKDLSTCEEAMFYLNHSGVRHLDRDHDGIPCETLCQ